MQKQGMIWYTVLKFLLPIGVVYNLLMPCASISSYAASMGVTFGEYCSFCTPYFACYIMGGFVMAGVGALLVYRLWTYDENAASSVKTLIVVSTCYNLLMFLFSYLFVEPLYKQYAGTLSGLYIESLYSQIVGALLGLYIVWIPTYFYVKKRTAFGAPHVIPAASRPRPPKTLPPPVRFSPIDLVPRRLSGITDQAERDRIVADIFRGNNDPYTQNPITCEADWDAYVAAYYADKDEAARKRSEALHKITQQQPRPPQPVSQPPSLAHVPPEQRYRPCADCGANIPYPEYEMETLCHVCRAKQEALRLVNEPDAPEVPVNPQPEKPRPLYCRLCGAKLHDDSLFCEFCGEPIPTAED